MSDLFDWSATPGSNTTVDGVNIGEGCPAANLNNGLRSVMALVRNTFASGLKNFLAGSSALAIANGGTGATTAADARTALGVPAIADVPSSATLVPTGAIFYFATATAPTGYLACDGAAISRSTYAALFSVMGTTHGTGDGSSTFNVPDLRGVFIRGWDNGRGIDGGRTFATQQADAFQGHYHDLYGNNNANYSYYGARLGDTASTTISLANDSVRGAKTDGVNGTPRTATETRPYNVALLPCIKV